MAHWNNPNARYWHLANVTEVSRIVCFREVRRTSPTQAGVSARPVCALSSKYVSLITNSLRALSHRCLDGHRTLLMAFLIQMSKDSCVAINSDMVG